MAAILCTFIEFKTKLVSATIALKSKDKKDKKTLISDVKQKEAKPNHPFPVHKRIKNRLEKTCRFKEFTGRFKELISRFKPIE